MEQVIKERFSVQLKEASSAVGVVLTDEQIAQCVSFTEHLLTVNESLNLTRIVEPEEVAIKHFVDSLTVFRVARSLTPGSSVIDVGTGAGFPGIVLKIVRPDLKLTLLDSLAKRLTFLSDAAERLQLTGVTTLHSRAEDAGRSAESRDRYDLVVARAVATLPVLLEWCGPLVRVGGHFIAMKGATIAGELESAERAPAKLGMRLVENVHITLPAVEGDSDPPQRHLLVYQKTRPTLARFPRRTAEIKASPL